MYEVIVKTFRGFGELEKEFTLINAKDKGKTQK